MLEISVPRALELARPKTTRIAIGEAAEAKPTESMATEAPMTIPAAPLGDQPGAQVHH